MRGRVKEVPYVLRRRAFRRRLAFERGQFPPPGGVILELQR
jgi:hypothetical protein